MDIELFKEYQNRLKKTDSDIGELLTTLKERKQELETNLIITIKMDHTIEEQFIRIELEPLIELIESLQKIYFNITKLNDTNV